ncbi:MAG TPA: PEP-CTERM sorting domain-containing protein [Tepidisphaeraceae bacterium]|jgi:hypothetical protein|nr:PEP-CTERM sorting domain-containing protein [Tepidisphaeraceae bacterium]
MLHRFFAALALCALVIPIVYGSPADTENYASVLTSNHAEMDGTGSSGYITFYANLQFGSSPAVATWFEFPIFSDPVPFDIENNSGQAFTLSNVGFMLSDTQIPLDDLNFGNDPPQSSFTPLPGFDQPIASGSGISGNVALPEPASIGVLAAAGVLAMRKRNKRIV